MTLLYVLLRAESDKMWYHLQRGSIFFAGWNHQSDSRPLCDRWLQVTDATIWLALATRPRVRTHCFSFKVVRP